MNASQLFEKHLLYAREPFTWKTVIDSEYHVGCTEYAVSFPKNETHKETRIILPDGDLSPEVIFKATQILCRLEDQ